MAQPDDALVQIQEALTVIGRQAGLHRFQAGVRARAGLTIDRAAYPVLRGISEKKSVRLSDLAQVLGVEASTVSRQVTALERSRLVHRTADPSDRRASTLALTPDGRRALKRLRQAWLATLGEIMDSWSAEERSALAGLLGHLARDFSSYSRASSDQGPRSP